MSHFAVLVIGDNVEEKMAPYQENNMGDCPKEFLKFRDDEPEYLEQYKKESCKMVELPSGKLVYPWDEQFRVPGSIGTGSNTHAVPNHLKQREVPHTERYATFEEFMKDYCGYKQRDPEIGKFGYWENPNARWDYWRVGGRYAGLLKVKPGIKTVPGELSWEWQYQKDEPNPYDGNRADQARFGDVDWDNIIDPEEKERAAEYWDVAMGDKKLSDDEVFRKFGLMYNKKYLLERFGTKEEYIRVQTSFLTFAVVTEDGKWHEKGTMGWFGAHSGEVSAEKVWDKEYWNLFLEKLKDRPNTKLTILDCHI